LFGWTPEVISRTLDDLVDQDFLFDDILVEGEKKPFYGVKQLK
jgi:hypothetical protein